MNHKILINCSNLHTGGGVAVASSFIDCLSRLPFDGDQIYLLLSSPVSRNLKEMGTDTTVFASCITQDFYGISALWKGLDHHFIGMDVVFTVFGPAYYARKRTRHLFGFAQPNIIYPHNPINARQGLLDRIRTRIKYKLQSYFFSRTDAIVVELEHVKKELEKLVLFQRMPIHIVYSSVHSVFTEPDQWASLVLPPSGASLKLGIISRNYPHKNLAILAEVKKLLLQNHGRDVDFYVTFPPDEWAACSADFKKNIINAGGLSLSQCPTFYAAMDGVVFPSMLECFSAVPIETMMSKRPLFASNLSFIRDVCGEHCNYFDPLNAADIALTIHNYFDLPATGQLRKIENAHSHVLRYPGPVERAQKYMTVIKSVLMKSSF